MQSVAISRTPAPLPRLVAEFTDVVAVYKPAGVPFHHDDSSSRDGLMHAIRKLQSDDSFGYDGRLYPVHRLDTVTSGVMLLAKSSAAAGHVVKEFRKGSVHKYYVALSERKPKKKQGSIVGDMERSRRSTRKLLHSSKDPAVTRFDSVSLKGFANGSYPTLVRSISKEQITDAAAANGTDSGPTAGASPSIRDGLRLYILKPETGRTHQIRVAMKSLGSPILGDVLYDAADVAKLEDRTYLHAAAVRLLLGSEVIQVVVPPSQGREFLSDACCAAFGAYFTGNDMLDGWFPDNKLLASRIGNPLLP